MAITFNTNLVRNINFVDGNGNSNKVKKVVKDGTTVWCKPYSAYVNGTDAAKAAHGSIQITYTEEPSADTSSTFQNGNVYFNDTVQCVWKGGGETELISTVPTSLSDPTVTNSKYQNYYFSCTIKNNSSVTITIYYRWANTPRTGGAPSYYPADGKSYLNDTIAAGETKRYHYFNVSNSNYATIYYYVTCTQTKTYLQKLYGPATALGTNVSGLSSVRITTLRISDTLTQYFASGTKLLDGDVTLNITYSETNPTSTTTLRNPSSGDKSFNCT